MTKVSSAYLSTILKEIVCITTDKVRYNLLFIFELSKPRIAFHPRQDKAKGCEVHVKAPEGFGILAYVQEAYLRQNSSDLACKDYLQFGQDDKLPFYTMVKSRKHTTTLFSGI